MHKEETGSSSIVELFGYREDIAYRPLKTLEAYWKGLFIGGRIPARADINPRGLENVLGNTFIVERIAPGLARFRLAGLHLVDLMGMEVRGLPLTSMLVPEARNRVSGPLEAVFAGPAIATITLKAERGLGKPALAGRMNLLPLRSDLGDVSRAIGCLVTDGQIGRTPRRFEIENTHVQKLSAHVPSARPRQWCDIAPLDQGISGKNTVASGKDPERANEHPHIRLVHSSDRPMI